jgi:hypothetical protein
MFWQTKYILDCLISMNVIGSKAVFLVIYCRGPLFRQAIQVGHQWQELAHHCMDPCNSNIQLDRFGPLNNLVIHIRQHHFFYTLFHCITSTIAAKVHLGSLHTIRSSVSSEGPSLRFRSRDPLPWSLICKNGPMLKNLNLLVSFR